MPNDSSPCQSDFVSGDGEGQLPPQVVIVPADVGQSLVLYVAQIFTGLSLPLTMNYLLQHSGHTMLHHWLERWKQGESSA